VQFQQALDEFQDAMREYRNREYVPGLRRSADRVMGRQSQAKA